MEPIIIKCKIQPRRLVNEIWVTYDNGRVEIIGTYYPDEISYTERAFYHLTRKEAKDMMTNRDKAYLQS